MSNLKEFVKRHLEQHAQSVEWKQAGESDLFTFGSNGRTTAMNCCVEVRESTRKLCISVSNGIKAPRRRMPHAYELVCRLNTGMVLGQFWLDREDGEVTFSITANLLELKPTERWFGSLVYTAVCTFDKYFPLISTVLYGKRSPKTALAAMQEPSDAEVTKCLERLFSTTQDDHQSSERAAGGGEANGDDAPAGDGSKRRAARRDIIAKTTPGEIEEIVREQRRRRTRKGKSDGTE